MHGFWKCTRIGRGKQASRLVIFSVNNLSFQYSLTESELLAAVKASLRRKVASLEDDNWIFEAEQEKGG